MANQKYKNNKSSSRTQDINQPNGQTKDNLSRSAGATSLTDNSSVTRKLTPRQEAMRRRQAARRRTRFIVIGLIGLVTVIAVGLILLAINQPVKFDNLPAKATADNALPLDAGLTPINQPEVMGAESAKVTITEYADFQCPACREFFDTDEKTLVNDYVKTGKVKFAFANFPFLDQSLPAQESHLAAEAGYCAADQNRFWDFHDALYLNQLPENSGKLNADRLKQLAANLGLNKDTFGQCLDSHKYKSKVAADRAQAEKNNVTSTPTLAVNGQNIASSNPSTRPSYDEIKAAIEKALASQK